MDNRVGREAEEDPAVEIIATLILAYKFITFSAITVYYCAQPSPGKCDERTWKLFIP